MVTTAALVIPLLALWLWWPCRMSRLARIALVLLTTAAGIFPALLLKAVQTGAMAYTDIAPLQVPGGWVLATLLMMAVLALLRDAIWLMGKLLTRPRWSLSAHSALPTVAALAMSGALSGLGVYNALQPPQIKEVNIVMPQLPQALGRTAFYRHMRYASADRNVSTKRAITSRPHQSQATKTPRRTDRTCRLPIPSARWR